MLLSATPRVFLLAVMKQARKKKDRIAAALFRLSVTHHDRNMGRSLRG